MHPSSISRKERVLIIKANQLGDSILDLPVVEELVARLGGDQVGIVTTPIACELYNRLVPEKNILRMSRNEFNGSWKTPKKLVSIGLWMARFKADWVLVPSDQGYVARTLSRLLHRGRVFEMENPVVRFPKWGAHFTSLNRSMNMHQNNWELFRSFAKYQRWESIPDTPPRPTMAWGFDTPASSRSRKVLIHPGSSREATRWTEKHFVALAERLADEGIEVLWMNESTLLPKTCKGITILERRPLLEFTRTAGECALFIGNNSGPMHLCDALNVPLLILCGPVGSEWDPYWTTRKVLSRTPELSCQPCETWGKRVTHCPRLHEPFACMTRITEDDIFQKAIELLSVSYS
jgi:ADP-heptose:LPS heptosyltransferase